jgi:hypothetical protein
MAVRCEITKPSEEQFPEKGILSETVHKNDHTALVVMHLAPGEELNEHTSKFPVWIQTMDGEGVLKTPTKNMKCVPAPGFSSIRPRSMRCIRSATRALCVIEMTLTSGNRSMKKRHGTICLI